MSKTPSQGIHHIALPVRNLMQMHEFYNQLPGLVWEKFQCHPHSESPRSSWFRTGTSLLMLEQIPDSPESSHCLWFESKKSTSTEIGHFPKGIRILFSGLDSTGTPMDLRFLKNQTTHQTESSLYFLDPEGNEMGYSFYPNPIPKNF